jgi:putative two-component system response regulator
MEPDKKCVLVVDDTPSYIMLLNMILQKKYTVKAAPKGDIALKVVRKDPTAVDLILLDIMMPVMDGFAVCQELKADPVTAAIPVIFISGKEEEDDQKKGLALGAVDFIVKPFDASRVLEVVARHLPS